MDAITVYLILAAIFLTLILLLGMVVLKRREQKENFPDVQRPRGEPIARGVAEPPRRAARNVRARMRAAAASRPEEDDEEDQLADEIALPEGKLGVKKRRKLEMKAEKRMQRERELEEREEKKQREKEVEDRRQEEEQKEKAEKAKQEEREKALKEEQERREYEEYLKLKESFAVEEEGFEEEVELPQQARKFNDFINYIKDHKIIPLEDLAAHFRMKTQDTINRVQELLDQEWINGVIDDRGKLIYITKEEMDSIAQFVKQRGRVSIAELAECSNSLINLNPGQNQSVSGES